MTNPLLQRFETPFESVPFDLIKPEHYLPAIKEAIDEGRADIERIKNNPDKPTFTNVSEAMELAGKRVAKVSSIFFNLHSAESNDELQSIAKEFSPILTAYSNDISLDRELFEKIKTVYEQRDKLNLSTEEAMLLDRQYKGFAKNGALLNDEEKEKFRSIDQELSKLALEFGDHVLEETNSFEMLLENLEDLKGLPEGAIEAASMLAREKGHEGKWLISLDFPSFGPFMMYAEKRELREKIYRAYASRCTKRDKLDNQEIVKRIANLRHERANLLGYKTHAHFKLEDRMAESPDKVTEFLNNLLDKAKPVAFREIENLKKFSEENGGPLTDDFMPWDSSYWSEKLRKEKFDFDEEELKPYFKLENVVDGVFKVAQKLYGINFKERRDIPKYHPDVKTFEIIDDQKRHVGVFYADFFPRQGKRGGAWMTSFQEQSSVDGLEIRPHVANVCNFTKPTDSKPSLLNFREVLTLFHEFGHGLHGMLSNCKYESLSGTNVYWDFVELPSQIFENWAYEKECLDLFAKHYETGESLPEELIEKIKKSSNFHEGTQTLRQLSFALLDMSWHGRDPGTINDVKALEVEAMGPCQLLPVIDEALMSCAFSHIFQGGYSAGYYSYKWAEVLDADAFEHFKENGIFNKEIATKFKDNILSKGGSEHPMTLYKRFRGQGPTPDALLKRAGLL